MWKHFFLKIFKFLNKLKCKVKNTTHVKGSIVELYITTTISKFRSYYLEPHVYFNKTRVSRNDDSDEGFSPLSIFNYLGYVLGE